MLAAEVARRIHQIMRPASVAAMAAVLVSLFATFPAAQANLQLRVLSNPRPDMVSGGDVLIQIDIPAGLAARDVRVTLNNADVTAAFRADAAGRALTGFVTGLANGSNALAAAAGGRSGATVTVVNHPGVGPVFSGPHQQPFICETENFKLRSGGTLGRALDSLCSVMTRVDYLYRAAAGGDLGGSSTLPFSQPKVPPRPRRRWAKSFRMSSGWKRARSTDRSIRSPCSTTRGTIRHQTFSTRSAGWNGRLIIPSEGGAPGAGTVREPPPAAWKTM